MKSLLKPPGRRSFPVDLEQLDPLVKSFVGTRTAAGAGQALVPQQAERGGQRTVLRPQRPLQQAAADQLRTAQRRERLEPDLERVRCQMVMRLQKLGLRNEHVIAALQSVPRHHFVDAGLLPQAYEDTSLPIGYGQTISKPSVVARMLELLCSRQGSKGLSRVLEIGTGCGYQAALLQKLAAQVVTIERLEPLHKKACRLLELLGKNGLCLLHGDGRLGHLPLAPYDGIIAAAGGRELPKKWLEQLAPGGRLVAPLWAGAEQVLMVVDRLQDGRFVHSRYEAVHFVPLKSGVT